MMQPVAYPRGDILLIGDDMAKASLIALIQDREILEQRPALKSSSSGLHKLARVDCERDPVMYIFLTEL